MIRQGPVQAGSVWTRPALSPAQWAIYEAGWNETARFRVAVCGRRFGKALALDTMLPGPGGWTRMGDVEPGTRLFDELGQVCVVTYATGIMLGRPCNTILFDDGGEITADDEHLWPVSVAGMPGTRLLTTRRIAIGLASGTRFRIPDRLPAGFTGER
ncbi:MAG: hypothetical protein ACRYFY_15295, partial [Janthinobacterium lividum]